MSLFPVNLEIRGRKVVVVGGGAVAERKCRSLLEAAAAVTVVAPRLTAGLAALARDGGVSHDRRSLQPGDLRGAVLAFAATDSRAANAAVAAEARQLGIPVCVADAPEEGTFTSPATVRRGDLLITVSTGGKSPALARRIRRDLEERYGPEYAAIVDLLGELREKLLTAPREGAYNHEFLNGLVSGDLSRLLNPGLRERLRRDLTCDGSRPLPHPTNPEESS